MKIIFCRALPNPSKEIHYCHFNHQNLELPQTVFHDLKPLAKIAEDHFFTEIEKWHSALNIRGKKTLNLWWLLPSTRLMSWAPPIYTPLFFNYLLQKLMNQHPALTEIYVVDAPREVLEIALDFFSDIQLIDQADQKNLVDTENLYNNHIRPYLAYIKNYLSGFSAQPVLESRPYLIHSMVLNADNLLKGVDHYFGTSLVALPENQRKQITYFLTYPKNSRSIKKQLSDYFNALGIQVVFTYDLITIAQLLKLIFISVKQKIKINLFIKNLSPINIDKTKSKTFSQIYARKILQQKHDALMELELWQAGQNCFAKLSPQKILFAYEERSLEHSLLLANQGLKLPAKTYGFVHAVINPGHLCYNLKSNPEANPPRPAVIMTTGVALQRFFIHKGHQAKRVQIIGSPRCLLHYQPVEKLSAKKKILFLEGQNHELSEFAAMIAQKPSLFQDFELTIRPKPYINLSEKKPGLELLQKLLPGVREEGGNLHQQLAKYDLVFFSTSSAGIEAILYGKIAFYLKLDQYLNLNPLESVKPLGSLVACYNVAELEKNLQMIQNLNVTEWNTLIQNQMKDAQLIYQPFNPQQFLN